jgi:hypothetical protein
MSASPFHATRQKVLNRGIPSDDFLTTLVAWAKTAPDEIFAPNDSQNDIYSLIAPTLGNAAAPHWDNLKHRRAAMMEVIRVHAGFESSWDWRAGVDVTNSHSMAHIEGQEAGILQISFDSTGIGNGAMKEFAKSHGIDTAQKFIDAMKADHPLALEYYARLVRINIQWAGPLKRKEIIPWLKRDAMQEFQSML